MSPQPQPTNSACQINLNTQHTPPSNPCVNRPRPEPTIHISHATDKKPPPHPVASASQLVHSIPTNFVFCHGKCTLNARTPSATQPRVQLDCKHRAFTLRNRCATSRRRRQKPAVCRLDWREDYRFVSHTRVMCPGMPSVRRPGGETIYRR